MSVCSSGPIQAKWGTWTEKVFFSAFFFFSPVFSQPPKGKGVYRACLNPHSGLLTKLELVVECADPSYVSLVAGDEMFCAVDEASGAMLLVDVNTGVVKQRVETVGKWPCHICVDNDDV
jgi:6-phosphogluconolactonase (cycloisomerase 2 family)